MRRQWHPVVVIAVVVAAIVSAGVLVVTLRRALETTACDDVRFRSSTAAPGQETKSRPPVGQGPLVTAIRSAFGRGSPAVFCNDFPDPFVLRVGRSYLAFSTNALGLHVPVLSSGGLFGSGDRKEAMPTVPIWAEADTFWAPAVAAFGDQYVMYYTGRLKGSGQLCISRAVAADPEGPYTDELAEPLRCGSGDALDPSPFVDATGQPHLTWRQGKEIVSAPLAPDGLTFAGPPVPLLRPDQSWEGGVVEGPSVVVNEGTLYLFYSGNDWTTASYAIGYAVCAGPQGPCDKQSSSPWLASSEKAQGPGGQEFFTDASENPWMTLHAWVDGKVGYPQGARSVFVLELVFVDGVPTAA